VTPQFIGTRIAALHYCLLILASFNARMTRRLNLYSGRNLGFSLALAAKPLGLTVRIADN
jgi:hypothetical protein